MKGMKSIALSFVLLFSAGGSICSYAQVIEDLKGAGSKTGDAVKDGARNTKNGVKKAGHAVETGTKKTGHRLKKAGSATGNGVKRATHKAAKATEIGAGKVAAKTDVKK
jgi:hypothetical protein